MEWIDVFPDKYTYRTEEIMQMVYSEDYKDLFLSFPYEYGEVDKEKEGRGIIQFESVLSFNNSESIENDPDLMDGYYGLLYEHHEVLADGYKKYRFCSAGTALLIIAKKVRFVET